MQTNAELIKDGKRPTDGVMRPTDGACRINRYIICDPGSAVVNTIGPIRQILQEGVPPRYLVIVRGTAAQHGPPVQIQPRNGHTDLRGQKWISDAWRKKLVWHNLREQRQPLPTRKIPTQP